MLLRLNKSVVEHDLLEVVEVQGKFGKEII